MADDLTGPIYQRLATDALIVPFVARYRNEPAVFTDGPIPEDVTGPWVVTEGAASAGATGTDALSGELQTRNIFVYTEEIGSAAMLDMIAQRVSNVFAWAVSTTPSFEDIFASASQPILADERDVSGRRVFVRFTQSTLSQLNLGFQDYETPVEIPDGIITNYSLTRTATSGSMMVWVNGMAQKPGTDFSEDADRKGYTFISGAPTSGSDIFHSYRY